MPTFHLTTLGCPKNAVDSEKLAAGLLADGVAPVEHAEDADLIVLNTCAFVDAARQESIEAALALADARRPGARLVLTGCMAERYGAELAEALPEADAVVGFAGEASLAAEFFPRAPGAVAVAPPRRKPSGVADLLDLPRRAPERPWAYLKVAEGCDRVCAFCAIPNFRGKQVSRTADAAEDEARSLVEQGVVELVLVAQDVASFGRDVGQAGALAPLMERLDALAEAGLRRQRLLYLYPSEVRGPLLEVMCGLPTAVPYFDLSLQHASAPLVRRMKRWGNGEKFLSMIEGIRARRPDATFRSSFIVGFPGETEDDHDQLVAFLEAAQLDWGGFFPFSREEGTTAAAMADAEGGTVPPDLVAARISELGEIQDRITQAKRHALVGTTVEVLVDEVGPGESSEPGAAAPLAVGRTHREAPEIDGVVELTDAGGLVPGMLIDAVVTGVTGPDVEAVPVGDHQAHRRPAVAAR